MQQDRKLHRSYAIVAKSRQKEQFKDNFVTVSSLLVGSNLIIVFSLMLQRTRWYICCFVSSKLLKFFIFDREPKNQTINCQSQPNHSLFPYVTGTQSVVASLSGGVSVASSAPTMQVSGPALKMNTTNHQPINQSYNNPVNVQSRHTRYHSYIT